MTKPILAAAAAAALLALSGLAHAQGYSLGALKIGHPWSPPAPAEAPTAAGYLTIANTGKAADRLLGATTPAADHVEIHQTSMDGAIIRMRPLPGGVAIAPGQTVTFAPAGYHLMLVGPKRPFAVGDRIPGVLRFERAGKVAIEFHVQATAPAGGYAAMDMR